MDQKTAEKLKRSSRKVEKCRESLHVATKDEVIDAARALIKAEAAHDKLIATIVESA